MSVKKVFIHCLLCILPAMVVSAQSQFSADAFMQFREANKTLTTEGLLQQYPAPTTYYSHRMETPDVSAVAWYDSIDAAYHLTGDEKTLLEKHDFMVTERLSFYSWINAYRTSPFFSVPILSFIPCTRRMTKC